ncbi:MAG TPA: hypothetical protein VKB96_15630, partial [Gammaproteobacteria bacterium]|nr:hypothetical protein [Gammaproteobacteria bacterium]
LPVTVVSVWGEIANGAYGEKTKFWRVRIPPNNNVFASDGFDTANDRQPCRALIGVVDLPSASACY